MKQKLYCYVDETGQDTQGELFIVVALVAGNERDELELFLEQIEIKSGKGKRKWIKSRTKEKDKYLELALVPNHLKGKIFYRIQKNTKAYEAQTVIAIEQALRQYISSHNIKDYKVTIIIDGLSETVGLRVGSALRMAGIKTRRVRGEKDESNALLRLTDMVVGLIRETQERVEKYSKLTRKLESQEVINELQ